MVCLCVDPEANPRGFEELNRLLAGGAVEVILILPGVHQKDEVPFLYLGGDWILEETRSHALAWVKGLLERLKQVSQEAPISEIKCRYYDCIESRLGEECNDFGRSTNRDYWIVMVEQGQDGHLSSLLHIQFHGQSPDYSFAEVLETIIVKQLESQLDEEVKPAEG